MYITNTSKPPDTHAPSLLARLAAGMDQAWVNVQRVTSLLRYHHPQQLLRRLVHQVTLPIESRRAPPQVFAPRMRQLLPGLSVGSLPQSFLAEELHQGKVTLLEQTVPVGIPIDWRLSQFSEVERLWKFHFQYQEFLAWMITRDSSAKSWDYTWLAIESWIETFTRVDPPLAWHPYVISRRIPVWIWLLSRSPAPPTLHGRLLKSLASQVRYLSRHLEKDLGGNHLWENARALAIAGIFFAGRTGNRWLTQGLALLDDCLETQLTLEGEHFERSVGYGARLADGLEELAGLLRELKPAHHERYSQVAHRMHSFLDRIRHPDGTLPLFGDTTAGSSRSVPARNHSAWVGDYFVHRRDGDALIFDAGDLAADHLPAHGHCDLLGYEISCSGRPIIVDSGVFCYEGPKRNIYRGSQAHNVLLIDDCELADIWSSFRMGRRGHVLGRSAGLVDEGRWIRARHDAFAGWGITLCERIWFLANDGPWFSLHRVLGAPGRSYQLTERIHWHPDCQLDVDQTVVRVAFPTSSIKWQPLNAVDLRVEPGWYSPDFHVERSTSVCVLEQRTATPTLMGWCLHRNGSVARPTAEVVTGGIRIHWQQGGVVRSITIAD